MEGIRFYIRSCPAKVLQKSPGDERIIAPFGLLKTINFYLFSMKIGKEN